MVGSSLVPKLSAARHEVVVLSTGQSETIHGCKAVQWNPAKRMTHLPDLQGAEVIINLAGANVGKRWTESYKKRILSSRIDSTEFLAEIAQSLGSVTHIINASASGIYQPSDEWLTENSELGTSFLAGVVKQWEEACPALEGVAVTKLRIGLVLSPTGGVYRRLKTPYSLGLGSPLGPGTQWMSWIHIDDLVSMFLHLIDNQIDGVFNATSPLPVRNKEFSRVLARSLKRPHFFPAIPSPILKLLFGEFAEELTNSYRLSTQKLEATGFEFEHMDLLETFKSLSHK